MSAAALDKAAAYAGGAGGGSGCIIRHGYLVKEWGDPGKKADIKSATKGILGATLLGLAVDAGSSGWTTRPSSTIRRSVAMSLRTLGIGSARSRSAIWRR